MTPFILITYCFGLLSENKQNNLVKYKNIYYSDNINLDVNTNKKYACTHTHTNSLADSLKLIIFKKK